MKGRRLALVIAADRYQDESLDGLRAPLFDATELSAVLGAPDIGGFETTALINAPHHLVRQGIEEFVSGSERGDLLLVYFSGHGLKDEAGRLYFATCDTRRDRPRTTAVEAGLVDDVLQQARARRQVVIVDCCFSGAFPVGLAAKSDTSLRLQERLDSRGRVVLTSSGSTQYSFEGNELVESAPMGSVFTEALVAGLRTGKADMDRDGRITVDELYDYVCDEVRAATPHQTPQKSAVRVEGEIVIASNPQVPTPDASVHEPASLALAPAPPTAGDTMAAREDERLAPPRRRWPWLAGVAATVALVAAVGAVVLQDGTETTAPAGEASPSTLADPSHTVAQVPPVTDGTAPPIAEAPGSPTQLEVAWTRINIRHELEDPGATFTMEAVAASNRGLIAVGHVGDEVFGDGADAAVWASTDGLVWSWVPQEESVFGGDGSQEMRSVARAGPGFVAVGFDAPGGDPDAAVWTSPDGATWSRVQHDEAALGGFGRQVMESVASNGSAVVAVGYDQGADSDAAVWTSPDGIKWSRVPHDEAVFGGDGEQQMFAVAAGGPGWVAVGRDGSARDGDAAVWASPDGTTWSRVADDETVFGGDGYQGMTSVVAGGPGLVGVGYDIHDVWGAGGSAAVWTSPDGWTWTRVAHDDDVFGAELDHLMVSVTTGDLGFVAVGVFGPNALGGILGERGDFTTDAAVWTSPDGLAWSRTPHDAVDGGLGTQMLGVVTGGPGVVAVGFDASTGVAEVWTAAG